MRLRCVFGRNISPSAVLGFQIQRSAGVSDSAALRYDTPVPYPTGSAKLPGTESPPSRATGSGAGCESRRERWHGGNLVPPYLSAEGANHAVGSAPWRATRFVAVAIGTQLAGCKNVRIVMNSPESQSQRRGFAGCSTSGAGLLSRVRSGGSARARGPAARERTGVALRRPRRTRSERQGTRGFPHGRRGDPSKDRASAPRSRRAGRVDQRAAAAPAGRGGASTLVRAAGSYGWQRLKTLE